MGGGQPVAGRQAGSNAGHGLWVRYGGEPVSEEQIRFAAEHYAVAIVQPREVAAASLLKELNPAVKVLAYQCLSSTRAYEDPHVEAITSGVSFAEAQWEEERGARWFARRRSGELIEWEGYPGHFQMNVWDRGYRQRWVQNVTARFANSPFDGVMADNDCYGDYYGLNLPIRGARQMRTIHRGLDRLIRDAGKTLNRHGKILVPNIAESRCTPGKWERHSAYGGGFEEVFLGWEESKFLGADAALGQIAEMTNHLPSVNLPGASAERLTLLRAASNGDNAHPNFLAGLAAFWVFGAGNWTALTATGHDSHNGTPWTPELAWNLGVTRGQAHYRNGAIAREFSDGWAAINLTDCHSGSLTVPAGMRDSYGNLRRSVSLPPHHGVVLVREHPAHQ